MILNKRVIRNIRGNLSFYISTTVLTTIAVFIVIAVYTAVSMINTNYNDLLKRGHVEDAQFTTLKPIDADSAAAMEEQFRVELEEIRYVEIKREKDTLRIFTPTKKINVYQMLEGHDIAADDEILLNRDYALANKIKTGDTLLIEGNQYKVSGFAVRPDYLYAQKDPTDFYVDDAAFGQVTMSSRAFQNQEHIQTYYSILFHENNEMEVRKYIYDHYFSLNYLSADSNNRISIVRDFVKEYEVIMDMMMPVMFILISFIVAVVLGRMIKREQKMIGTLVASGYRRNELFRHYAIYAMIPGAMGSLAGIVLSLFFLKPACILFATDFERINFEIHMNPAALLICILMPIGLYMGTSVLMVAKLLRNNTILLISGNAGGRNRLRKAFLANSRLSFRKKFQFRALLEYKSRTMIVITGMFIGGFLCVFGFIFMDSCNYLVAKGLDSIGSYEYQYFLNTVETTAPVEGEPMLTSKFEVPGNKSLFFLNGLIKDQKYLKLSTKSHKPVEYGKYYMTSNAAALYGIQAGDRFTFMQIQTMKKYTVQITDIVEDNTQCALYTSMDNMAELLGLPKGSYNTVVSDRELPLNKDLIYKESSKETVKEQLKFAVELMFSMIYLLIILGSLICIISTYLTVNMLVTENRINISMLKVLGYRNREINSLVLNVNHILLPVSYGLSVFACLELCGLMFKSFIAEFNLYLEPVISIPSLVLCMSILTVSYFASLTLLKRKVYHVDMVESLKDNRE